MIINHKLSTWFFMHVYRNWHGVSQTINLKLSRSLFSYTCIQKLARVFHDYKPYILQFFFIYTNIGTRLLWLLTLINSLVAVYVITCQSFIHRSWFCLIYRKHRMSHSSDLYSEHGVFFWQVLNIFKYSYALSLFSKENQNLKQKQEPPVCKKIFARQRNQNQDFNLDAGSTSDSYIWFWVGHIFQSSGKFICELKRLQKTFVYMHSSVLFLSVNASNA